MNEQLKGLLTEEMFKEIKEICYVYCEGFSKCPASKKEFGKYGCCWECNEQALKQEGIINMNEWEERIWKRLQEELPITESDANDFIIILKKEIRQFAEEIFKEEPDTEAWLMMKRKHLNNLLEERNIAKI